MILSDPIQTINFGKQIAKKYPKILLYGDLGSGKTHLVKGFAQALGIPQEKVQSPTYTYINIYDQKLLHIDMYRLQTTQQLIEKGILEQIENFQFIAIEWPKFEELYIDPDWIKIYFEKTNLNGRKIKIEK